MVDMRHVVLISLILPRQHLVYFSHESSDIWQQEKNHHKREQSDRGRGAGGCPLLEMKKERRHYWQLCPLWARQRRIVKEKGDMKEGQSELKTNKRKASQPHESTLRLTPSYSLPLSIGRYSTSSQNPVVVIFDVILFVDYWGRWCWRGKHLWFTAVTQQLLDVWEGGLGRVQHKS